MVLDEITKHPSVTDVDKAGIAQLTSVKIAYEQYMDHKNNWTVADVFTIAKYRLRDLFKMINGETIGVLVGVILLSAVTFFCVGAAIGYEWPGTRVALPRKDKKEGVEDDEDFPVGSNWPGPQLTLEETWNTILEGPDKAFGNQVKLRLKQIALIYEAIVEHGGDDPISRAYYEMDTAEQDGDRYTALGTISGLSIFKEGRGKAIAKLSAGQRARVKKQLSQEELTREKQELRQHIDRLCRERDLTEDQILELRMHGNKNNPEHVKRQKDLIDKLDRLAEELKEDYDKIQRIERKLKNISQHKGGRVGKKNKPFKPHYGGGRRNKKESGYKHTDELEDGVVGGGKKEASPQSSQNMGKPWHDTYAVKVDRGECYHQHGVCKSSETVKGLWNNCNIECDSPMCYHGYKCKYGGTPHIKKGQTPWRFEDKQSKKGIPYKEGYVAVQSDLCYHQAGSCDNPKCVRGIWKNCNKTCGGTFCYHGDNCKTKNFTKNGLPQGSGCGDSIPYLDYLKQAEELFQWPWEKKVAPLPAPDAASKEAPKAVPEKESPKESPYRKEVTKGTIKHCNKCQKRHPFVECRCGKIHCFKMEPCDKSPIAKYQKETTETQSRTYADVLKGKAKDKSSVPAKEMPTEHLPIDVDMVSNLIEVVNVRDANQTSVATKVKFTKDFPDLVGKAYLCLGFHQLAGDRWVLRSKGNEYALPNQSDDCWIRPFEDSDGCLLDWTWFKGKCPQVNAFTVGVYNDDSPLTFLGIDPRTHKKVVSGLGKKVNVKSARIEYAVSTVAGCCGSIIVCSYGGQHYVVGMHNGTKGGGKTPNYSIRLDSLKPKN